MTGGIEGFVKHGETEHPDHFLVGAESGNNIKFSLKKYYCALNDKWYSCTKHLARAIKAAGWTNERYFNTYGEQHMADLWSQHHNDEKYGDARATPTCLECQKGVNFDSQAWSYPVFCGFSCSTKWHAVHTDRIERAQVTLKERQAEDGDYGLKPNQYRYWTIRGLSDEEAAEKVRQRQTTNTLAKFIERYGEDEGTTRFLERQEKWFASMKASGMFSGYSRVAVELFSKVAETIPDIKYGQDEVDIRCGDRVISVDCLKDKKVIEFFGDYWHANPSKYDETHSVKGRTAPEIWAHDDARTKIMEAAGYDVMIIWEDDYQQNPDLTLGKCLGFLKPFKYMNA